MRKIIVCTLSVIVALGIIGSTVVQAGTRDMVAGKKLKFEDDSVKSMRDVFERRDDKEKYYRETMTTNSNLTVELLADIKDLLRRLNNKE